MTGLYAHIPFCSKKCHYCDFVTAPDEAPRRAEFLGAFAREAERFRARFAGKPFATLYVGGGTPSTLDAAETRSFFSVLRENFTFAADAEVAWEANPGDVTPAKAALYAELGVNRVSVGAQSFDDGMLAAMNRAHGSREIRATVEALRGAGIRNLNLDLMTALPGQSREAALESADRAVELAPDHISLYELTVEEDTVFGAMKKSGKLRLPGETDQLETLVAVRARLVAAGYEHYELLNFAKPGKRSRHNLLYWANGEHLGLGPGAWSYVDGRRWRTASSVASYLEKARAGDWAPVEEESLDPLRREGESLLLALRLAEGAAEERFPAALSRLTRERDSLVAKGLLSRAEGRLRLTDQGKLFAETVFTELSLPPA